jgi:hypothetical protein
VRYSVFLMHRRKDLWGPDGACPPRRPLDESHNESALKFDPDRFLDERVKKYLTPNPFIFLPFNAGMHPVSFLRRESTSHQLSRAQDLSWSTGALPPPSFLYRHKLTPPRPQFALNEASFFLVRLLQNFTGFALAPDAQP